MKKLLLKDKRGVSIMIAYVLLIVLALTMAVIVYSFMKFYLPKDKVECPQDVSLAVTGISCTTGGLTLTIENRGLFSVYGAHVKMGSRGSVYKDETFCFGDSGEECEAFLSYNGFATSFPDGQLSPGGSFEFILDRSGDVGDKELEIDPVWASEDNENVICTSAIVLKDITCSIEDAGGGLPF